MNHLDRWHQWLILALSVVVAIDVVKDIIDYPNIRGWRGKFYWWWRNLRHVTYLLAMILASISWLISWPTNHLFVQTNKKRGGK